MNRITGSSVALVSALIITAAVQGDIISVPVDQVTIQDAINAASDGDEVVVAPGTYPEVIDFSGKAITLRSSDGATVTTIDGAGLNNSVVSSSRLHVPMSSVMKITSHMPSRKCQYMAV